MILTLVRIAKTKILLPWSIGGGTLGIRIPGRFYADLFIGWGGWWNLRAFVRINGQSKTWYTLLPQFRWDKQEGRDGTIRYNKA